ncbi:CRISPR-associated protein, Cas5d family [Bellilinea caldifistulae]|uniref:pre-crRNA processing endonuclease n=1 Tax=Bellilinea caldifistulae TaxID=360411 RepID=A0A0P6XJ52_9CHLR|nr:type I-C CRISPR-associated protein Cas5c [Bellilinea caldifistulae]KPL71233.1 CRISPR-associated protein [Bellilinea caldifistulae]GAP10224.1 CRISPR-associated protein, Cas5d family [Bellilinea caldifistulae]
MGYGIIIRVEGSYALFTRPEMKVERVSYDVITPSAARGIIEAVYWKPAIRWVIDKIHVLREIQFTNIRRNEVSSKASVDNALQVMKGAQKPLYIAATETRQQRAAMVLKDVDYVIEAHFDLTDKAGPDDTQEKHYNVVLRRLRNGQRFHTPCLGTREFPAKVTLIEDKDDIPKSPLVGKRDLGYMLYDLDFSNPRDIQPMFFRAVMENGVIVVPKPEEVRR